MSYILKISMTYILKKINDLHFEIGAKILNLRSNDILIAFFLVNF